MRIFIAFPVAREIKDILYRAQIALAKSNPEMPMRWVEPVKMHVTLEFLGDLNEEQIAKVKKIILERAAGRGPFGFQLEEVDGFKHEGKVNNLIVTVAPSVEAVRVQEGIAADLREEGIAVQERPWKPHITLGRMKTAWRRINGLKEVQTDKIGWQADEVMLMASIQTQRGYEYKRIEL